MTILDNDSSTTSNNHCDYYEIDSFNHNFKKFKYKNSFNVIALNIQSCNANFVHFTSYLEKLEITYDVIILTETFLTPSTNFSYEIEGYNSFTSFKTSRRGGVKVYCNRGLNAEQLDTLNINNDLYESVFVKIFLKNKKPIILGGVYRPPSGSLLAFNNHFDTNILAKLPPNVDYVIGGDFNINLINPHDDRQTEEFGNLMLGKSMCPLITKATHRCPQTLLPKTLIDHIWSSVPLSTEAGIIDYHITNHMPTSVVFPELQANSLITIKFRDFSSENYEKLANEIDNLLPNLNFNLNADEMTIDFVKWLNDILNKYFPIKTKNISLKRLKSPWLSSELLLYIDRKHTLFNQLKHNAISKDTYNNYKNLVNYTLKLAKQNYFVTCYKAAKYDIAKSWKITNSLLNKNKNSPPIKLVENNQTINNPKDVCNKFAKHYQSAPLNTRNSIPDANNPVQQSRSVAQSMFFTPASNLEIIKIIKNFKNKKVAVEDFPVKLLKFLSPKIANMIGEIFNYSFDTEMYPDSLKIARVVPIFKSGSRLDVKNYRPVSILTNINKIFEKLVHSRLGSFLENYNVISYAQYGFCKGKSTTHATYEVLSKIQPAFTKKMFSICVFADFSKAFDTVDHPTLLRKLNDYGIRGSTLAFIKSYLTNRKQFVSANGVNSDLFDITYGVPQGSVLGPLFFNIYANEISHLQLDLDVVQYADDTVLMTSGRDVRALSNKINNALKIFADWCSYNKLALNISKTKYIVFSPSPCPEDLVLSVNGTALDRVAEYKYLGVIIDEKLKFNKHISTVISKLSRLCGITYKLGRFFTFDVARCFYFTMVQSIISYNIIFWGASSKSLLESLQRKQNIIMRNLFKHHLSNSLSTSQIFAKTKILKISDFHKYSAGITLYKTINFNNFPLVSDAIISLKWNHSHNTRRIHPYRLPLTRVDPDINCFLFQSVSLFNALPASIVNCSNIAPFKKELCKFLMREY